MSKSIIETAGETVPAESLTTRRAALGALARASALVFLPVGTAVAKTAEIAPADGRLIEIDRRHAEADDLARRTQDAFSETLNSVWRAVGPEPRGSIDYGRSDRSVRRQLRAHERAAAEYQARKEQAERDLRVDEAQEAHSDAGAALLLLEREVWETPAVGFAGLRAKARMAKRSPNLAHSLVRDLLAMEDANG